MQPANTDINCVMRKGNHVEYAIKGGPEMGSGIHETETKLCIALDTAEALVEEHQPSSIEGGEPLGTFRGTLQGELLSRLHNALSEASLWSLPPSTSGGPGSSTIRIRHQHDGVVRELQVASRDIDALEKLDPVLSILNDAIVETVEHPLQAIQLSVVPTVSDDGQAPSFTISVKNVGTKTVAIPDLRIFGGAAQPQADGDLSLRVATYPQERPGYTAAPLVWERLSFSVPESSAELSFLAPGQEVIRGPITWVPTKRGERYLVQAGFSFYGSPAELEGHLVIKGRALSEAIEVTAPK